MRHGSTKQIDRKKRIASQKTLRHIRSCVMPKLALKTRHEDQTLGGCMNHRNTRILTLLSLAVLWLANTAHAQYVPRIDKVNVPFDFTVSDKSFPSGEYSLVCTPLHLKLRDSHNRVLASLFPHSVESMEEAAATKLQFSTEGDRALLRLWIRGDRQG